MLNVDEKCGGHCGCGGNHGCGEDCKCEGSHEIEIKVTGDYGQVDKAHTIFSHSAESAAHLVSALRESMVNSAAYETIGRSGSTELERSVKQGSSADIMKSAVGNESINFGIPYTDESGYSPVNAASPVEHKDVADFHSKRLLFIVIGPKVYSETEPSGMSHMDWVKTLDVSGAIIPFNELNPERDYPYILHNFTRGYYYNNEIVMYKGMNFRADSTVVDTVRYCMKLVVDAFRLTDDTLVGMGCIITEGEVFPVQHRIGTLAEIKEMKHFGHLYKLFK